VRRAILSLTLPVLLIAGASGAEAGGFDARIGGFFPRARDCGIPSEQRAEYTLFQDDCELYFVSQSDFDGIFGGAEYSGVVSPYLEVGVHVDGYGRSVDTSYRDYVRPDGSEIFQTLKLTSVPVGVTLRIIPTGKRARVAPYVGGGVDAVFYTYEEFGDFIDFFDPDLAVVPDHFRSDGVAFGVHAVGGLRVYLNRDFAITGEGRYLWAGDDMGDDFAPNEPGLVNRIDLGGWAFTVGLHVRF
jgi:hypothetical protein